MDATKRTKVESLLARPILGRLATSSPAGQPHVVPVWFLWEEGVVWVSSFRNTRKVKDLERNPKCAIVVDLPKPEGGITAVLLEGTAELTAVGSPDVQARLEKIYVKYLGTDGLLGREPQNWLTSPDNRLIKLKPARLISW
ncbi:MAG TPA: pyridoxamine 5'-phosphate oxidase family protein [Anaerolineales bacterium]|nr:pyridoxamine 5'-phosphate oxidase family protein [Anaerolineales bacterium]